LGLVDQVDKELASLIGPGAIDHAVIRQIAIQEDGSGKGRQGFHDMHAIILDLPGLGTTRRCQVAGTQAETGIGIHLGGCSHGNRHL